MSEGKLIRQLLPFERNYTEIPNAWVRDERLTFKAQGILVRLMSHKPGWTVTIAQLASTSADGIAAVRSGVVELEQFGYLIRRRNRRGKPDDWEIRDPTGVHDPTLFGAPELRPEPVDKSRAKIAREKTHAFENRTRSAFENRTPIEDQLRNNSLPSATIEPSGSAVDNSERSAPSPSPASASPAHCRNGHPIIGYSGGGVPFCAIGCVEQVPA